MYIYNQQQMPTAKQRKKQLYVTWFSEDDISVQPVLEVLSERGTAVELSRRSTEKCRHDDYVQNVMHSIDDCNVGLVMLSKSVFNDENQDLQQLLWFEIGYMMSKNIKLILFFLDIPASERNDYLNTTPVRQVQGTDSVSDLMDILEQMNVQEKVFYEDPEINRFASKRIFYMKLTTMFQIYKNDMDSIFRDVQRMDDDIEDEDELLTELLSEINCGCTVISFNDQRRLKGELEPYFPEVHTIIRDYPIRMNYSKPKLINKDASPEVYATVQAEFIIPVHNLLGVTFKPFMAINKISHFKIKHLEKIIQSNSLSTGGEPADCDMVPQKLQKEQRLYFLFDMYAMESWEGVESYGRQLNYMWPQ